MKNNIVCVVVGTHSYLEVIEPCLRRIRAAVHHARTRRGFDFHIVGVTDHEGHNTMEEALHLFGDGNSTTLSIDMEEGGENYKEECQLLIANLQQVGFDHAILRDADLCWSVESDILVPHNALSCMMDMLEFDDGYYDVAFCTYPSHSGGMFLGGNGSDLHPIEEDYLPSERRIPEGLMKELKAAELSLNAEKDPKVILEIHEKLKELNEKIKQCPPNSNVFALNGEKWRRRGWFDHAFPAIGKGAVLETDWTGLGCNLLSRKALTVSSFDGYDGRGTQDLFLNWRRWKPAGIRMCVIPHAICEHVVRKNDGNKRVHCFSHHEPRGEMKGHLRVQHRPYYRFDGKDSFDPENNGLISPKEKK